MGERRTTLLRYKICLFCECRLLKIIHTVNTRKTKKIKLEKVLKLESNRILTRLYCFK